MNIHVEKKKLVNQSPTLSSHARLASRLCNLPMFAPLELKQVALKRAALGAPIFDFGLGDPFGPIATDVKQAALSAIRRERTRYTHPSGLEQLRSTVLEWFGLSEEYTVNDVVISSGAGHSLLALMLAICNQDDCILLPATVGPSYASLVQIAGARSHVITSPEDIEHAFKLQPNRLIEALSSQPRARMLILSSPCNPTGQVYSGAELSTLLRICADHGVYLILDRRSWKISFDSVRFEVPEIDSDLKPWLVHVDSLSNNFAHSSGFRVGWCVGPPDVSEALSIMQSHCGGGASTPSQYAAASALEQGVDEDEMLELEHKRWLFLEASATIPEVAMLPTYGTFFSFWDIRTVLQEWENSTGLSKTSDDFAEYLLESFGIVVVPGSAFRCDGFVRLSFAVPDDTIRRGIPLLHEAVIELLGSRQSKKVGRSM